MNKTTRIGLQEPENTPQVFSTSVELLNTMSLQTNSEPIENSKSNFHVGCGYNTRNGGRMSAKYNIFVLDVNGKPLTPTTNAKARKLMKGKQAKPIWNKFSQFGIQMLVETREETPKTILGCDFGTKFEGYSIISGNENILNVMWKLPDKKKLIRKIEERKMMREVRRQRNCRRRPERFDNRKREGFIAPSQLQIVNSRLKCMNELFKTYPINKVAIEDVKFNHRDKRYGKNFTTIEVGKTMIKNNIIEKIGRDNYITFDGYETQRIRERLGLSKSSNKSAEIFNSHCVDSFVIASEISEAEPNHNIIIVDDTYRYVRRKLHDTQYAKGNIRAKFSRGNFKGIRKGTICEFGQIVGGTKEQIWYCDFELQNNGVIEPQGIVPKSLPPLSINLQ